MRRLVGPLLSVFAGLVLATPALGAPYTPPANFELKATVTVPGTADAYSSPAILNYIFATGVRHDLVASGVVQNPPAGRQNDALYCFGVPGCETPQAPSMQMTYDAMQNGSWTYSGYELYGDPNGAPPLPYESDHQYRVSYTAGRPTRIRFGACLGEASACTQGTGAITIKVYGPKRAPDSGLTPVSSDPRVAPIDPDPTRAKTGGTTAQLPNEVGLGPGVKFFPVRVFSAFPPRGIVIRLFQRGRLITNFRFRLTTKRRLLKVPLNSLRPGAASLTYRVYRRVPGRQPVGKLFRNRFVAIDNGACPPAGAVRRAAGCPPRP